MKPEDYEDVAARLKRVVRSPKPYHWFFCAKGEDGKPALLVGKREGELKILGKAIRKVARDKKSGRGRVFKSDEGLVFGLEEGNAPRKEVEKAIKLKIAREEGLKPVKGLLRKARVVEGEELERLLGQEEDEVEVEESDDRDAVAAQKLQARLDRARSASKAAWDVAVSRVGKGHADLVALGRLQERARVARQEGLAALGAGSAAAAIASLREALDLYEEIGDGAAAAGRDDRGPDDEDEEDEAEDDEDALPPSADPAALLATLREALDEAHAQIAVLRRALIASGDADLEAIAELGLAALTANHRTRLAAALTDAAASAPAARPKALAKARDVARAFLAHVRTDPMFEVCDENPFGVRMSLRATLGSALERLVAAL